MLLTGKRAIITGAASGIGKAVASKMAENGANVVLMDIQKAKLDQVARELQEAYHVEASAIQVDCQSTQSIKDAMEQAHAIYEYYDVLANCAGICISRKIIDADDALWDKMFNINLKAIAVLSSLFMEKRIALGLKGGHIVSISSQASKIGEYGNGIYSITKAGVNMLTQVLALEFAEYGASVMAVCPGYVNTEMLQGVFAARGPREGMTAQEYEQHLKDSIPVKRLCEPEEVANLMTYLASDQASYITGTTVTIAGGTTLI